MMRAATRDTQQQLIDRNSELEARLAEAEETLRAIRAGEVDAVVVSGPKGEQVYSLTGAESVYRLIVETMQEAAVTVALDGTILYCNAQFGRLIGRPPEQIIGHRLTEFVADGSDSVRSLLRIDRGQPVRQRLVFRGANGTSVPAHVAAHLLDHPEGPSICIVAADLTELENSTEVIQQLRRQDEALRRARDELEDRVEERTAELAEAGKILEAERQRLYDVLESLPAYVILLTPDYHVPFANRYFEEHFGKARGRRCFEYLLGRTEPCEDCESFKVLQTGAPHHWEWNGPDGRDYAVTDILFADADDPPLVMEMGIDITERKRAERDLVHRSEQLRALASQLTLAEQRERQRLAQVLHDGLQQILVGARYRLSVLENTGQNDVRQSAAVVSGLLNEAIDTSRSLTSDLYPPILHGGGLVPAFEWLVQWMQDRHGLGVELQARGEIQLAEDLKILLFQATRELLFNVVKHAGITKATVQVSRTDGQIRISVADDGAGFDVRSAEADVGKGGGFGLFAIRERLDLLGGQLEIDSAPGRGSRFSLVAPLEASDEHNGQPQPAMPARPLAASPDAGAAAAATSRSNIRVVLVDDHVVMRQGLTTLIAVQPDMTVVGEASDGQSAVELVRRARPDVVVIDVSMPGMNGIEATRIIHAELPDVKVIGLSMHEEADRADDMLQAGAVDYLNKSGPSEALIAAIRRCVGSLLADDPPAAAEPERRRKSSARKTVSRRKQ
jgi:PAS domain S-box-containing protein